MTVIPRTLLKTLDQRVAISLDWAAFEKFLELRGDAAGTRLTYSNGRLEIMSPSENHEAIKTRIGRLLECWSEEFDVELDGYGSWTVKNVPAEVAAEADECYVLGDREPGKHPDLAIEVNWSKRGLDKLDVWRQLAVPEVWVWEEGRLRVFRLTSSGYKPSKRSKLLPEIDLALLSSFVGIRNQLKAVKAYRAALQKKRQMR